MARQRKLKQADKPKDTTEDIPDEEKWRLIEQTGLLKKIPKDANAAATAISNANGDDDDEDAEVCSPFCNEVYNTILYLIPFTSLYLVMEVLAHRQYAQRITGKILLEKTVYGIPFLYLCIFNILRYKSWRYMQLLLFLVSVVSGCRMVYVVNWESWKVVVAQCAPLGTAWVLTVAMMDLTPAVLALGAVGVFVWWKGLKIIFD